NYWLHNGFLNLGEDKMSKSLGNVELVHNLVTRWPGEALRWALLASHYRQPLAWTEQTPLNAKSALDRLYGALLRAADVEAETTPPGAAFMAALEDDLNTPRAYAELFAVAQRLETAPPAERRRLKGELLAAGQLLGFLKADPEAWFQGAVDQAFKARIEGMIDARARARAARDWATADRIRDEIAALGVEVLDGPDGATWRIKEPT
ncbi:MAG TPA: DALR domain-containing protein, partial [Caulobacteraceae bacterium]|nr:DALR domain-containing protein [Caulobacteraceae bacterium]